MLAGCSKQWGCAHPSSALPDPLSSNSRPIRWLLKQGVRWHPSLFRSACQASFTDAAYDSAMKTAGSYEASGNLFWLNPAFNPTAGVPISQASVDTLRKDIWSEPGKWPNDLPIVVAVPSGTTARQLAALRGNMQRMSCPEVDMSLFAAIAADVDAGCLRPAPRLLSLVASYLSSVARQCHQCHP